MVRKLEMIRLAAECPICKEYNIRKGHPYDTRTMHLYDNRIKKKVCLICSYLSSGASLSHESRLIRYDSDTFPIPAEEWNKEGFQSFRFDIEKLLRFIHRDILNWDNIGWSQEEIANNIAAKYIIGLQPVTVTIFLKYMEDKEHFEKFLKEVLPSLVKESNKLKRKSGIKIDLLKGFRRNNS